MNFVLLAESIADPTRLTISYVTYAAIIIVGIVVLLLLRSKTRLPRHAELHADLEKLSRDAQAFVQDAPSFDRVRFFKEITRLNVRTGKLVYVTDRMADRERDGELSGASVLLEQAQAALSACKFGSDMGSAKAAHENIAKATALIAGVLERDKQLRGTKK